MIEEFATVSAIDGKFVTVNCAIKSSCSGCKQLDNCGSGQISKAFPQKQLSVTFNYNKPINIGDNVIIGLSEKCIVQAAWQVYLLPLLGLISFSALGQYFVQQEIFSHELLAIALGFIGGYMGYGLAKFLQNRTSTVKKMMPQLLRVVKNTIPVTQINT